MPPRSPIPPRPPSRRPRPAAAPYHYLLDVPFAMRAGAQAGGAVWDAAAKAYMYVGQPLPAALAPFRAAPYSWEAYQEGERNGGAGARAVEPPEPSSLTLRPHQVRASEAILAAARAGRSGFLLADDVGLGKTLSALHAALTLPGATTLLIVCPLAVVPHWRATVAALGDHGRRIVIINYDRLGKLFEAPASTRPTKRAASKRTRNKRLAARGAPSVAFDTVIFDESHRLRNVATLRAKFAARLVQQARFTLWLSATAGQNPLELAYLAPLLAESTGSRVKDLQEFETWCQDQGIGVTRGGFGKWVWDASSPTAEADLTRVREMLFGGRVPAGLRRRPEDLIGWPAVNRVPFPIALDGAERALYDASWREFRRAMQLVAAGGRESTNRLVAQLRFRQKASLLHVPGTVALVDDLRENGYQVAVSCEFLETLEALRGDIEAAGHPCVVVHGQQTATEKERARLAFQRGQVPVVLYTVTEAISLHAGDMLARGNRVPRANVIADCRYSGDRNFNRGGLTTGRV